MTELEKQLFDYVKEDLDLIRHVVDAKSSKGEIHFPIMINGSLDTIIKDTKTGDIKLRYNYTKKKGVSFLGNVMADFKDIQDRYLDLNPLKKLI